MDRHAVDKGGRVKVLRASPTAWAKGFCALEVGALACLAIGWPAWWWLLAPAMDVALRGAILALLSAKAAAGQGGWGLGGGAWCGLIARGALCSARAQWMDMGMSRPWSASRALSSIGPGDAVAVVAPGYACGAGPARRWARALRERGFEPALFEYSNAAGSIDEHARELAEFCRLAQRKSGRPPLVAGHSMGGLCAARAIADGAPALALVAVAAPFSGTQTAGAGAGAAPKQMAQGSAWLAKLRQDWQALGASAPALCCMWSACDAIVSPGESGAGEGFSPKICLPARRAGHLELLSSSKWASQVAALCEKAAALASERFVD